MGRDFLGDDLPPDEINIVTQDGHYGWPFCYGKEIRDLNFETQFQFDCGKTEPSLIDIPAHSAPLGLAFIPPSWPEEFQYNLLVAFHGSWNRSIPTGYKLYLYKLDQDGNYLGKRDFVSGWLTQNNEVLGRPADIFVNKKGVIFVSDDKRGVIYKINYRKQP